MPGNGRTHQTRSTFSSDGRVEKWAKLRAAERVPSSSRVTTPSPARVSAACSRVAESPSIPARSAWFTRDLRFLVVGSASFLALVEAERGVAAASGISSPVAPLLSASAMSRRRADGGSFSSADLPALMTVARAFSALRVAAGASAVCCTTLSLNSSTLPLEPNRKNACRSVSGPPLPTTQVDGMIWKVSSVALARQPSSKK